MVLTFLKLYLHRLPAKAAKMSGLHFWEKKLLTVEKHRKEKIDILQFKTSEGE